MDGMPREAGVFDWIRRMGVHEAHHLSGANRAIHWMCIPIELCALVKIASLAAVGPVDLALVLIVAVAPVYIATDRLAGALMTLSLVGLRLLAVRVGSGSVWLDGVTAAALFTLAFVFQTRIGHGLFERGVDDTEENLTELRRTRSVIPVVLIFYYHLVEVLFAVGYRPALRTAMERYRRHALTEMTHDPRRR
jgi:uncharacterized membrane protein YGL010W